MRVTLLMLLVLAGAAQAQTTHYVLHRPGYARGEERVVPVSWRTNLVYAQFFDLDRGTNYLDYSLYLNDATAISAPSWAGRTIYLDGTNNVVFAPDSASLDMTNQITINCWIKTIGDATFAPLAGKWENGVANTELSYAFYQDNAIPPHLYWQCSQDGTTADRIYGVTVDAVKSNVWMMATAVWTPPDQFRIFMDSTNAAITTNGAGNVASVYNSASKLRLGKWGTSAGAYRGDLDAVTIYDRALTAVEITNLYTRGR